MIKEIRDIETNELTGYQYNRMFVPLEPSNRHYQEIQELIENGELVEPAFTEEERLNYFKNKRIQELKQIRETEVGSIIVTLSTGEALNGDEIAQTRMSRALTILPDDTTEIAWIDANNELVPLTRPKFQEALQLAGTKQAEIFAIYNQIRDQINAQADIEALKNGEIDFTNGQFAIPAEEEANVN